MDLIIVESPTKAKTLTRFLGSGYDVLATYGHVTDLPEKKIGVKVSKDDGKYSFDPQYVPVAKQKDRVEELLKESKKAEKIYLATDPDREGEAIAWHVGQMLTKKAADKTKRIVFHEITQKAIKHALEEPGQINMELVEAQQARRVLDRLVGYKLSPVLWRKVRRGLSAGRVQSVALRLIVEREREIEAFKPVEYWVLQVVLKKPDGKDTDQFTVKLAELNGEKLDIGEGRQAAEAESDLRAAEYHVDKIEEKEFRRTPPAPFTTSTLQQTAANRMGWSAKKTMQVAQSLYEGGYITYHRTDSTNIAQDAASETREFILGNWGREYALSKPRFYKTKSKVAQEAHETIRPTDVNKQSVHLASEGLNRDQTRLYDLIWKRFVACQMAEVNGVSVSVSVSGKTKDKIYGLKAKGETVNFDGWTRLYEKNHTDSSGNGNGNGNGLESQTLPEIAEGDKLDFRDLSSEQKFTQPPARYNDASLIKALEERGIGRPSTYAPTLSTIQDRRYVERTDKRFSPTVLGIAVNDFLVANFPGVVDYGFTAAMEDKLDDIANGQAEWQPVVGEFYGPFDETIKKATDTAARVKVEAETTGEKCPKCGQGEVVIRMGRFGKFLACSRYPDCDYKDSYVEKIGVECPKCGGDVIVKHTKSKKTFYGCSNYPKCDFASWTRPTPKATEGDARPGTKATEGDAKPGPKQPSAEETNDVKSD